MASVIATENAKPGTPESQWLIGSQDSSIEGFTSQFTVDHGQRIDFKINTPATDYRIDIYRLGYYGGDGARQVASITEHLASPQVQPAPKFDPTLKLVDAGNWSVSASWNVPADAVSGVYFAELTRLDSEGGKNIIPFIVRDDEAPSDITFQTSDTTWEAYNPWGGYNFYGGKDQGGNDGRAFAVSYNRPITTRDGGFQAGPQDFLFGEEYPAIRWLEENGYDVNYISGMDTARSGAQLLNSKTFLSVGHDEYWSADQRANVEAARDAGVNLAFLSGNEDYWETRWAPSIDGTNTPFKTLISYKERWDNANIDPNGTTSTWRDAELGAGQPENSLSGTIFTVDAYRQDTIQIPYAMSNFRFWRNTAVDNLQPGQTFSLTPNLLGYEWDSDLDNGSRPAGLIDLSSTTVNVNSLLLDYGNTVGNGTATHNLTLYRAPSGALVFGAGTVYWSWGLDSHHDNEATPTDPNVQQAMVNLFADMGVQPTTLMASLKLATQSTDHTAPVSVITSPTGSSFTAGQQLVLSGTATDSGGGSVAVVEVSTDGGTTWHRATGFENWTYTWTPLAGGNYTIKSRAVDDSVNMEKPGAGKTISVTGQTSSFFSSSSVPGILSDPDGQFVNLGIKFTSSQSGSIVGVKFYKGLGDGGFHVGSLWSSTGTLLATAQDNTETETGWQTIMFDHPVAISAGTTYVASYHSNGHYADTDAYFTAPITTGPLTALAGNGLFTYSASNAFPTLSSSDGSNYWVDPIFAPSQQQTNQPPVAANDSGFTVTQNTAKTFTASQFLANDTDPNGDPLTITGVSSPSGGTVAFNSQNNTVTFTPTTGYTGPGSFNYSISDGRGGTSSAGVSLTVTPPGTAVSLFTPTDTPSVLSDSDTSPVTLGVKFTSSTSGFITGLEYYKGVNDTGTHVGSLWSSTGTQLASVTFTNETSSGWQTASFSSPVAVTAGTTYVASYHSNGHYADTSNYFTTNHVSGVLTAPASGNGVYTYGSGNAFPTSTFSATNYWVDVQFTSGSGGTNRNPVAVNDSGFNALQNTAFTVAASALLANDSDPDGDPLTITGASGGVNGTATLNAQANTITFTPTTGFTGNGSFNYAISDGRGGTANASVSLFVDAKPVATNDSGFTTPLNTAVNIAESALLANDTDPNSDPLTVTGVSGGVNGTASFNTQTRNVTFTPTTGFNGTGTFTYSISDGRGGTASANVSVAVGSTTNQPPTATNDSGFSTAQNTPIVIPAASLLANDTDPNGDPLSITGASGGVNGTANFNAQTNAVTFTPTAGFTGNASFNYAISDGRGGTASAAVSLAVTAATSVGLFSASDTPAVLSDPDAAQVNLGVRFVASTGGTITGLKYYKGANDTGTHVGSLWSSGGTLLASATFTNETSSGWQTVTFTNPVSITAGTTYVASYHSNGHYTDTGNYFTTNHVNGALTAPAGNNGVYTYGAGNLFPTSTFSASNYWVDITFNAGSGGGNQPPVATADSGFATAANTPLTLLASTLLANDTDPNGDTLTVTGASGGVNGTASFNATNSTVTFTPTAGYTGPASFNYAISDGHGGTASAGVSLSVTNGTGTVSSFFTPSSTPAVITDPDAQSVELGLKFQASSSGQIVGIRFYKGPQNTGSHVADLWSSSGSLLASANFTNETASGWQEADFTTPVSITAGTTYIASYHSNGHYSADPNYFATAHTSGPLTAPSSASSGGNGVYAYGTQSLFPNSTFNATSYGVDVLFRSMLA